MSAAELATFAKRLHEADIGREQIPRLTDEYPDLTLQEAYEVQRELLRLHGALGHRLVGAKLGLTSRAKQAQMEIDVPIWGFLTEAMRLDCGEPLPVTAFGQPRVEPEIAFLLGRRLEGPSVTATEVLMATEAVCPALEVLDSRFAGYAFTLPDVVADNTSAARFVLGPALTPPAGIDLRLVGCVFEHNGRVTDTAAGAASLGHPAAAVAALVRGLAARGDRLESGSVVLSGGLTAAVPVAAGDVVTARFDRLGTVEVACL